MWRRALVAAQQALATWRDASPGRRLRLVALNAAVLVAFSAVTVDALTRTTRLPAQGTLGMRRSGAERSGSAPSAGAGRRVRSRPAGSDLAQAGTTRRRLLAPGLVTPSHGIPRAVRRRSPGEKRRAGPAPANGVLGITQASPVDVMVAYPVPSTTDALATALGLAESPGDSAGEARAVVRWVNANGGLGGHPVQLRLTTYDPSAGTGFAAAFAPVCAAADAPAAKPLAVIAPLQDAETQSACLASRRLVLVGDGPAAGDSQVYARAGGSLFAPGSMSLDRVAGEQASALGGQGFLARPSRVGIVRLDAPAFARAARSSLRTAAEATGAQVVAEATVPRPYALTDVPGVLAAVRSAVLQLRAAGVDRVLMLDAGLIAPLFMRDAESEGYRPRYGLNSTMAPATLPDQVPAAQLRGAVGVGHSPLLDVSDGHEPDASAQRRTCDDIYRSADVRVGGRSVGGRYSAIALCGELLTIRAALNGVADPTPGRLSTALERMPAAPATVTFSSRLDGAHHDGAAATRPLAFDAACRCMRYTGDARDVR